MLFLIVIMAVVIWAILSVWAENYHPICPPHSLHIPHTQSRMYVLPFDLLRLQKSDRNNVSALLSNSDVAKYYTVDTLPWSQTRLREYMRCGCDINAREYTINIDGKFAGIAGITYDSVTTNDGKKISGDFIHIAVSPEYQGKGIATKTIGALRTNLCADSVLYSKIHPDNIASLRAHEKNGFEIIGKATITAPINTNTIYYHILKASPTLF